MRLSFRDLNEAFVHPRKFKKKLREPQGPPPIFKYSYYNVLINSIYHFHNCQNDPTEGDEYLIDKLSSFKNEVRKEIIYDQFRWYIEDYINKNITTFEVRQNIKIIPEIPIKAGVRISGQINRLDILPSGGYIAWLFRNRNYDGWKEEFCMPLIQYALANQILNVPSDDISIGIYSFTEEYIDQHCYSQVNIQDAKSNFEKLLISLGLT